ncbi:hypothetical protein AbraIFM66950_011509 [Aspergillus brasiliensis]|nr:hypothetical protein AbraIFM66950_011509 [Aspergillus brasiliensis]
MPSNVGSTNSVPGDERSDSEDTEDSSPTSDTSDTSDASDTSSRLESLFQERRKDRMATVRYSARMWHREMMSVLLDSMGSELHLTCGVIKAAVANEWYGVEVISLFLENDAAIKITKSIAVAAFGNRSCGRDILMQLLSGPGVSVSSGGVEAIAALFDVEVVKLLLNNSDIRVADKALVAAARSADLQIFEMLFARTNKIRRVEDIALAAAGNQKSGWQIFRFLFDCGLEITASERVWKAAAGHEKYGRDMIGLLFDHQGKVLDSEEVIAAAARNTGTGKLIVDFLLDHAISSQLVLTDTIILAAADNGHYATELIDLLLEKSTNNLRLTERIVESLTEFQWRGVALRGMCHAIFCILKGKHKDRVSFTVDALVAIMRRGNSELICGLLDILGEKISITEEMVEAVADNDVASAVPRLLRHTPSVKVTEKAVSLAAKQGFRGKELLEAFFKHDSASRVPPEAIEAAAGGSCAYDIVEILLDQTPTVQITEKAIAAAGHNLDNEEIFDLFLSKCKGEIRLSLQGMPNMKYDSTTAPTIDFIKRALSKSHGATVIGPPIEEVVILDNPRVVKYMLMKQEKKSRSLPIKAAEGAVGNRSAGKAVVEMLLACEFRIEVTESVVRSAAGSLDEGYEIMDLLLHDRERVTVSTTGVEAIVALMPADIVRVLLKTRGEVAITTRMMEEAAKNGSDVLDVLLRFSGEFPPITDGVLQAAASNPHSLRWIYERYGDEVEVSQGAVEVAASKSTIEMQLMLEQWGNQIQITTKVMEVVATTNSACETVVMLFEMRLEEIYLGEDFWVAVAKSEYAWRAEETLDQLLEYCDYIRITEGLVAAALKNGKSLLRALLDNDKARVTASGVQAIARSFDLEMFTFLLDRHGEYINFTERTMEYAAENEDYGWEIVELLVRTYDESRSWCSKRVIEAAARNPRDGKVILELLLCEFPGSQFSTAEVLIAAAENRDKRMGEEIIELLLSQQEDQAVVTSAVIDAAIANSLSETTLTDLRDIRYLRESLDGGDS